MWFQVACCAALVACVLYLLLWPDPPSSVWTPDGATDYTRRRGLEQMARERTPATGKRYVVVGTGSVGMRIAEALVLRGEMHVVGFDIAPPRRKPQGVTFVRGDVTKYDEVRKAIEDADVVFSTFALIRPHERMAFLYGPSHAVNVTGTQNVVRACVACGVRVLIQTSTSNVCIAPGLVNDHMDEHSPYVDAKTTVNHYSWTKVQAERAVLEAHGTPLPAGGSLATGVIRPCSGLFGPEDVNLCERWLRAGRADVTAGWATIDWVFVDDVVWAEFLLEKRLHEAPQETGGQPYCVSQDEPVSFHQICFLVKHFYERLTQKAMPIRHIPPGVIFCVAWGVELVTWLNGKSLRVDVGKLTPAIITVTKLSYVFKTDRAKKMLGWAPLYTLPEAVQRTVAVWLEAQQRAVR